MYCLMSARSTNARSILSVTLEVVRITTLGCLQMNHGKVRKLDRILSRRESRGSQQMYKLKRRMQIYSKIGSRSSGSNNVVRHRK